MDLQRLAKAPPSKNAVIYARAIRRSVRVGRTNRLIYKGDLLLRTTTQEAAALPRVEAPLDDRLVSNPLLQAGPAPFAQPSRHYTLHRYV